MGLFKDIGKIISGNTDEIEWWDKIGSSPNADDAPRIPTPPHIRQPTPLTIIALPYGDGLETLH